MYYLKLMLIAPILLASCGQHQYDTDRNGSYGDGPLVDGNCASSYDCDFQAKQLADQIRSSDPSFEKLYFHEASMDDALRDYFQHGYIKKSSVRILKIRKDNGRLKAIVSIANLEGEPTQNFEEMELSFVQADQKDRRFPIARASNIFENRPSKIRLGSVLDYSGSMSPYISDLESATFQMYRSIEGINGGITKFSSSAASILAPTTETAKIQGAIFSRFDSGSTALFDGIQFGLSQLEKNSDGNDSINLQVVFTDGEENSSNTSYDQLKGNLKEYRIPQIILGMGQVDIKSLITFAADTNGLFYYLPSSKKIESSMQHVSKVVKSLLEVEIDISANPDIALSNIIAKVKDR